MSAGLAPLYQRRRGMRLLRKLLWLRFLSAPSNLTDRELQLGDAHHALKAEGRDVKNEEKGNVSLTP
eukprot:6628455-Pyramimonas_sp.AAC.1